MALQAARFLRCLSSAGSRSTNLHKLQICWLRKESLRLHQLGIFKRNAAGFGLPENHVLDTTKRTSFQLVNYSNDAKVSSNTTSKPEVATDDQSAGNDENEKQLTVLQRFKKAYREHTKILIGVHLVTSAVWYGSFVYAAHLGVDVVPLMEWLGFSEKIINPFKNSGAGDYAVAYLMYKLATPARYTVTLTGVTLTIKYLRKTGKMEPKQEKLRDLVKDSREEIKERSEKFKEDFKEKRDEFREKRSNIQNRPFSRHKK